MSDVNIDVGLTADDVAKGAEQIIKEIEAIFKATEGRHTTVAFDRFANSLREIYNNMGQLIARGVELENTTIMPEGYDKLVNDLKTAQTEYANVVAESKKLADSVKLQEERIAQLHNAYRTDSYNAYKQEIMDLADKYAQTEKEIDGVTKSLRQAEINIKRFTTAGNETATQKWQGIANDLNKQLELLKSSLNSLESSAQRPAEYMQALFKNNQASIRAAQKNVDSYKHSISMAAEQVQLIYNRINKLRSEISEVQKQAKSGSSTEEYAEIINKLERDINRATLAMRQFYQNGAPQPHITGWKVLVNTINQGPKAIINFADTIVRTLPPAFQVVYAVVKKLADFIINEFKSSFELVKNSIQRGAVKAVQLLGTAAKSALSGVKKLVSLVGQLASSYVGSKIKGIADSIGNIGKSAKDSAPNLKQIGRMFLQYGIGARSLYRLINKLRTALFEGFADLALAYQPFNEAMSSIVTALDYLKNSFAAAFAPIIEFVSPAVSLFVNKMADAVQMVGQFIAALTGKEFVMALPVYKDYAESTKEGAAATREQAKAEKQAKKMAEDEAKAQKKREKALKDVKRTIAGFDDVEILKEPSATTQENLTASIDPDDYNFDVPTLERAMQIFKVGGPLQDGIQQFADLIKKAWLTADAYDLGQRVNQSLQELLRSFYHALPQIQEFTTKVAKVIASFLAGFLSIPKTFSWLGLAIAGAINTVFKTIEAFLTTFMNYNGFKNLGKAIYNTITTSLANINWETIYNVFRMLGIGMAQVLNETIAKPRFWDLIFLTICNAIRALLLRAANFITTLHWDEIGLAIAHGVNTAINNFPFDLLASTLANFINGIFSLLRNFIENTNWNELGHKIGKSIVDFIDDVSWEDIILAVNSLIGAIFNAFQGIIDEMHFDEFGDGIANSINLAVETFPQEKISHAISTFLGGLWTMFVHVATNTHWGDIGTKAAQLIIGVFDDYNPEEVANGVIAFIDGLWDAFMSFVNTPGWDKVVDKIASTIVTFAKNFKWKEKLPGLLKFLNNAIDGLTEILDQLDIPKFLDELYKELKNSEEFQELCEKIVDLVIYFTKLKIKAKFNVFKLIGGSILGHITSGVSDNAQEQAYNAAQTEMDALGIEFSKKEGDANSIGSGIGGAIDEGLSSQADSLKTTASNIGSDITGELDNADEMRLIGGNMMTEHNRGLMGVRSDIQGSVRTISQDELDAFDGNDFESIGRNQMSDLKSGIDSAGSDISNASSTIKSSIESPFANFDGVTLGKNMLAGIWQGIQDNWSWLYNTVWDLAEDLWQAAKNALGIASPSKVFRDKIGEMIPAGIGVGIEANADSAINSVDSLSNKLVDTAKNIKLPPIAMGEIIPYSVNTNGNSNQTTLSDVLEMLQYVEGQIITRDELNDIITTAIRNFPVNFYLGDEQVARHANNGNKILNRRFSPTI